MHAGGKELRVTEICETVTHEVESIWIRVSIPIVTQSSHKASTQLSRQVPETLKIIQSAIQTGNVQEAGERFSDTGKRDFV